MFDHISINMTLFYEDVGSFFKRFFKKPKSDLKTEILIRKSIEQRLDRNETIELLIDLGYDKSKAKHLVNEYYKKRSKEKQQKLQ